MDKETIGTVLSVAKQWWLKVNTKPIRMGALDGATFPHIIKVQYVVDGNTYTSLTVICLTDNNSGLHKNRRGNPPPVFFYAVM